MADEYIRKAEAIEAVDFGITLASAINLETGEWSELFKRENDELREAIERIQKIEPADVVQVVHGRWVKYTGMGKEQWMCSECSAEEKNPKIARYCYYCGAKMDGERKE